MCARVCVCARDHVRLHDGGRVLCVQAGIRLSDSEVHTLVERYDTSGEGK